jgi:hypothetical protein
LQEQSALQGPPGRCQEQAVEALSASVARLSVARLSVARLSVARLSVARLSES